MAVPDDDNGEGAEPPHSRDEPRVHAAWRSWLAALASDADVALSAALAYEALDAPAREAWLSAVEHDAPALGSVPAVALYAPLLAVEDDPTRRARIVASMSARGGHPVRVEGRRRALRADLADGQVLLAIVSPLYLGFVEILVCRVAAHGGVLDAAHEPLLLGRDFADVWEDVPLREVPLDVAVEDIAHAVVADRRDGRVPPEALVRCAHLLDAA